jgi:hypothetical protein
MKCPKCQGKTRVTNSRDTDYVDRVHECVSRARDFGEEGIARERYCASEQCGKVFYTIEKELK